MFADRHILEGSLEHRIMGMTRDERLARARELIALGRAYLPLLAKVRAGQKAKIIEYEPAEVAGGDSSTEVSSAESVAKSE